MEDKAAKEKTPIETTRQQTELKYFVYAPPPQVVTKFTSPESFLQSRHPVEDVWGDWMETHKEHIDKTDGLVEALIQERDRTRPTTPLVNSQAKKEKETEDL